MVFFTSFWCTSGYTGCPINRGHTDRPFNPMDVESTSVDSSLHNSTRETLELHEPPQYYGEYLATYRNGYESIHGYLSFTVCLFGITANVLNIFVLSRKVSSTNVILTSLGVADILMMLSSLPFTFHNYIRTDVDEKDKFSYSWAVFTLFHAHFTVVSHAISIWLTVVVAIWRFIAVSYPFKFVSWCSKPRAKCAIVSTCLACVVLFTPTFANFNISRSRRNDGEFLYRVVSSQISKLHDHMLEKIRFLLVGVVSQLVPCIALTSLSLGLVLKLHEDKQLRKQFDNLVVDKGQCTRRLTGMILAILLLFLLTELPSGLLALISVILGRAFFDNVYINFGATMDALALVNIAANLNIYCYMNRRFRATFAFLFLRGPAVKNIPF